MSKFKSLSILENVNIAAPCHEAWDKMPGDAKERHCEKCLHSVTNLSALTRRQAADILVNHSNKRICVRYHSKPDGSIKFQPDNFIFRKFFYSASIRLAAVFAVLGLSLNCFAQETESPVQATEVQEKILMGEMMPVATATPVPKIKNKNVDSTSKEEKPQQSAKPRSCQTKMDK